MPDKYDDLDDLDAEEPVGDGTPDVSIVRPTRRLRDIEGKFPRPSVPAPIAKDGLPMIWNGKSNVWFEPFTGRKAGQKIGPYKKKEQFDLRTGLRDLADAGLVELQAILDERKRHRRGVKGAHEVPDRTIIALMELISKHTLAVQVVHMVPQDDLLKHVADTLPEIFGDIGDFPDRAGRFFDRVSERASASGRAG